MKMKKALTAFLALIVVLLSACGDDEKATPKAQFDFGDDEVSLKDANLYLLSEDQDGNGHIYRDYFITDGVYGEGSGWSMSDYTGATYLIAVQVGVPTTEEILTANNYPLYYSFSSAPENSNIGWFSFDSETTYYETPDGLMDGDPIVLSGHFDDGDMMTIKFNGTLQWYGDAPTEEISGTFYFRGTVQDVRGGSAPARQAAPAANGGIK